MKLCSWTAGCAQETSSDAELCEYHDKVSGGLLGESAEAGKVAARRLLRRQTWSSRTPQCARGSPELIEEGR